jgi:putative ABC transport system permease protein
MMTLWQDIRYGLRMLGRSPGFTAVVLVILAVGIGANTAVFSVVNAVMLRPLPYKDAHRLVGVYQHTPQGDWPPPRAAFLSCRALNQVFEQVAGYWYESPYVRGIDKARQMRAASVSSDLLPLLGLQPMLGRGFLPEEEQPGHERVVILSHAFWRDELDGTPEVLGTTVNLDNQSYTVVGVLPPDVALPFSRPVALWLPLVSKPPDANDPAGAPVVTFARLRKGVTLEQARAALGVVGARLKQMDPGTDYTLTVRRPLDRVLDGKRRLLLLLLGASGFVLLIACSNVANLFLARAAVRRREMAMRAALGASRGRVLRQMLTESLLLSLAGGALGLLVTFWMVPRLVHLCPADIPRLKEMSVDGQVLGFTLGVSILTGLLFGVTPAWRASDVRMNQMLQEGTMRAGAGRGGRRLHDGLVIAQMGLSLILLIGAALLIRSMVALHLLDLGFRPENVLAVTFDLPRLKYPEPRQCQAFFEALLPRVRALPQVRGAGLSLGELGLGTGGFAAVGIRVPGRAYADPQHRDIAMLSHVSAGFLETLGVPLLRGRPFTEGDATDTAGPIILDERLARQQFGDADPIGQRIDFPDSRHTVVGVVGNVWDFRNLGQTEGTLYTPIPPRLWLEYAVLIVRTEGNPVRLAGAIRAAAAELEKDEVIGRIEMVDATLSGMLTHRRFSMILLSLFAGIALTLATVGIYGLLHYRATQQTRDIGIRMALGARKADIRRMVLRQGLGLTLIGVLIGVAGALALTRVLSSLLYGVSPTDPLTLASVSLVLVGIALLASYLPARRAAKIDPMVALRYE